MCEERELGFCSVISKNVNFACALTEGERSEIVRAFKTLPSIWGTFIGIFPEGRYTV